ncbi:kelch domain-containing protein 8B-like [Dendronephthya gigantea]|uniref:kelch domain-containing protein 8B-like n=1 Tax=Dendronephthya gigantea TaxID=151771 RepID=UPI00106A40CD|nr:kelch domain-containing protein 8B-like [Dendronephthya gigantea]
MASYTTGYDDELFQHPVGPSLHCCICTSVIKDPVMCRHNEHIFCRSCITRHLINSQTCPTCMESLTVDTLKVPRTIANLLSELKIRCEFFNRGCEKFVELGDLEKHVADCGFAPAVCSNEGCGQEVDRQDLFHHETVLCKVRRDKCHSCNALRREMDILKVDFGNVNAVVENVGANVELLQRQVDRLEERNRLLEADNVEMKKFINAKNTKQPERMSATTSTQVQHEQKEKEIAEIVGKDRETMVVVAGGSSGRCLNSVEMFSLTTTTWTLLDTMKSGRQSPSSVIYNNQLLVTGGYTGLGWSESMEKLSLIDFLVDQSTNWEDFSAELPRRLAEHCTVVVNGKLIVIGGYDGDLHSCSDNITEIFLSRPHTKKVLTIMPQGRCYHGVAIFGNKIFIFGGRENLMNMVALRSVVMYDITKNKCQELAPLPYPVSEMATVKWDEDNVILMGGVDSHGKVLSTVLMYNITTQKSYMLPDMKYKRRGCVAAVVKDAVIVMAGRNWRGNDMKSVERFTRDKNSWEKLPDMHEARYGATAVVW